MKRVKRYVSVLLTLCMVLGLFPASVSASEAMTPSEKKEAYCDMDKSSISAPMMLSEGASGYIRNTYIEAYIASNGQFTMGTIEGDPDSSTDNNKMLLFGHPDPWSSETLVRIDDVDYWFHEYVTDISFTGNQCVSTALISGVEVRQILTLMKNPYTNLEDLISIQYAYTNISSATKQIGIRVMLDTMLGDNDGAPFRVNGADVVTEVEYTGNSVPQYWQSFDSLEQPNVTATGFFYFSNTEAPDKVQFTHWGSISGSGWDYQVTGDKSVTGDSAVAAYFNPRAVAAGGSNSVVTYYGISGFSSGNSDLDGNLAVRVTAPSALYGSDLIGGYLNNPFDVSVYLSNVSEDTLSDVTAVLSLENAPQLTLGTSQATTILVGDMTSGANSSLQWTLRAIPQGSNSTAQYSISFYEGDTLLKKMNISLVLYELNEANMYRTVSFDLNGGDGTAPTSQRVLIGTFVNQPEDPTRDGYVFAGWYANPNCTGLPWFNLFNLFNGNLVTNDVTLYARWTKARSLTYGSDTYNFENTTNDFFGWWDSLWSSGNYQLTGDYYDIFLDGLTRNQKTQMREEMNSDWGGSCFGMSTVLSLVRARELDVSYFQDNAIVLHDFKTPNDSSAIFNLINYYHLMQMTPRTATARGQYDRSNETPNNRAIIDALNSSAYPVVVGFNIIKNGNYAGGHAVVAYDYTEDAEGYAVSIWDPNNKNDPNVLRISKDYTTSNFESTYDSGDLSSYMKYALTVENGDYDYKNIQDELTSRGYSSGADATALLSMLSMDQIFYLQTNYDTFTIFDSDGSILARIENGMKVSGELDISNAEYLNEVGPELNLLFTINGADDGSYTIVPDGATDVVTGEPLTMYTTALSCDDNNDGFYTVLDAAGTGAFTFCSDGTLETSFAEPIEQSITTAVNDATTSWYAVTVQGITTGMIVTPKSDSADIFCAEETEITVIAEDDYNTMVFEPTKVGSNGVALTEDPENPGTGILGTQKEILGHALIFFTLGGTPIEAQANIPTGSTALRPADPVRGGFVFSGWYTTPDCSDGNEWSFDTPITEDTRIYAKWLTDENYTHTVTFKADGQDDIVLIVRDGETLANNQIPVVPMKNGFTGAWDITDFANIHADLIANAIYTPSSGTVTVTYIDGVDGAEVFADQVYTVELGDPTPAFSGTPSRTGYTFAGWNPTVTETVSGTVLYTAQWTPNGGSSGGGGSVTTYPVTNKTNETNGSVKLSQSTASSGTKVTVTVTPDSGYVVDHVNVTDKNGNTIRVTDKGDGTYTFIMPASRVWVEAVFAASDEETDTSALPFLDIPAGAWYESAVRYVYEKHMMSGTGEAMFSPDLATTRAMIVTILYRLEGSPAASNAPAFTDVTDGQWYSSAIAWAATNNIVGGYGGGLFGPNDTITREQMAAILHRYAQYKGYDVTATADLSGYVDAGSVSTWAQGAMQWANGAGLITGNSATTLNPLGAATRAEVASILMRFCENIAQ